MYFDQWYKIWSRRFVRKFGWSIILFVDYTGAIESHLNPIEKLTDILAFSGQDDSTNIFYG
jgi:hypothetical protein